MKNLITLLLVGLLFAPFSMIAQDGNTEKKADYLWDISANVGSSLMWGDAASSGNPFARWFSKESSFTGGLTLKRKLSNTFSLQVAFQKGMLSGERTEWSDDAHGVVNFSSRYFDYHIGLDVDFTSLFGFKPDRLLSVYGFAGVGMTHYDAESAVDAFPHSAVNDKTLIIPWGGGLRLRLNERWSIYGETNFRNSFVDDLDAYIGGGTDVNDIYSITGIGVTYKFGQKKDKKPKVEIAPVEPADSAVAEIYTPVDVEYTSSTPTEAEPNSEYLVKAVIEKGDLNGKATYELSIPEDFYISELTSNGGTIEQDSNSAKVVWEEMPEGQLEINYKLSTGGLDKESYVITSNLDYEEKGENMHKTYNTRIALKPTAVAVVETPKVIEDPKESGTEKPKDDVVIAPVLVAAEKTPPATGLEYRVQVATVFGGTTSKRMLQKRLGLEDEVKEDPYKNSYRYTVGSFTSYSEAAQHAALSKVRGAYVVVFKDGKYIGGLENTNADIMDQNGIYPDGSTYKVQIAASKGRTYSIAKLAYKYGLKENEITEDEIAGWYQYTVGTFRTSEETKQLLNDVRLKVPKAYVVKFEDGKRSK